MAKGRSQNADINTERHVKPSKSRTSCTVCLTVGQPGSRATKVALRPVQARCGFEAFLSLLSRGKDHKGMRPDGRHPELLDLPKL